MRKLFLLLSFLFISLIFLFLFYITKPGTYEAYLTYTPLATGEGPIGIKEASVYDFKKSYGFSLRPLSFPTFSNIYANISVFCNGVNVYSYVDRFRMTELGGLDRTIKIFNIPPGSTCKLLIDLDCKPFNMVYCSSDIEYTLTFSPPQKA